MNAISQQLDTENVASPRADKPALKPRIPSLTAIKPSQYYRQIQSPIICLAEEQDILHAAVFAFVKEEQEQSQNYDHKNFKSKLSSMRQRESRKIVAHKALPMAHQNDIRKYAEAVFELRRATACTARHIQLMVPDRFVKMVKFNIGLGLSTQGLQQSDLENARRKAEQYMRGDGSKNGALMHLWRNDILLDGYSVDAADLPATGKMAQITFTATYIDGNVAQAFRKVLQDDMIRKIDFVSGNYLNAALQLRDEERELGALKIKIGRAQSKLAIFESGNPTQLLTLNFGIEQIIKNIARQFQLDMKEAGRVFALYGDLQYEYDAAAGFVRHEVPQFNDRPKQVYIDLTHLNNLIAQGFDRFTHLLKAEIEKGEINIHDLKRMVIDSVLPLKNETGYFEDKMHCFTRIADSLATEENLHIAAQFKSPLLDELPRLPSYAAHFAAFGQQLDAKEKNARPIERQQSIWQKIFSIS